eukprot:742201_1
MAPFPTELHYSMNIVLLSTVLAITRSASPCIRSYTDHTINYISNNMNIDSDITYLGHKTSANDCQNSCSDFNYLCGTSSANIGLQDGATIVFDSDNCAIEIYGDADNKSPKLTITEDLKASEYIIEVELTMHVGYEAGFWFKANNDMSNHWDYWVGMDPGDSGGSQVIAGWDEGSAYEELLKTDNYGPSFNTRTTVSAHIDGNNLKTYFEDSGTMKTQHYSGTMKTDSRFAGYAGLWTYEMDATYHSFKIAFPDTNDNADETFCASYLYDKSNSECYGYYGNNYDAIETSLASDTQQIYDSAILYHSGICPSIGTTPQPSPLPTKRPTTPPSKQPTAPPTKRPTAPPNKLPTAPPTTPPTAKPSNPGPSSSNPTRSPFPGITPSPSAPPTPRPSVPPTERPTLRPTDPRLATKPTNKPVSDVDVTIYEQGTDLSDSPESTEKAVEKDPVIFEDNPEVFIGIIGGIALGVCAIVVLILYCAKMRSNEDVKKLDKRIESVHMSATIPSNMPSSSNVNSGEGLGPGQRQHGTMSTTGAGGPGERGGTLPSVVGQYITSDSFSSSMDAMKRSGEGNVGVRRIRSCSSVYENEPLPPSNIYDTNAPIDMRVSEDSNNAQIPPTLAIGCTDCGEMKSGQIYDADGLFYCWTCWETYDNMEYEEDSEDSEGLFEPGVGNAGGNTGGGNTGGGNTGGGNTGGG